MGLCAFIYKTRLKRLKHHLKHILFRSSVLIKHLWTAFLPKRQLKKSIFVGQFSKNICLHVLATNALRLLGSLLAQTMFSPISLPISRAKRVNFMGEAHEVRGQSPTNNGIFWIFELSTRVILLVIYLFIIFVNIYTASFWRCFMCFSASFWRCFSEFLAVWI